MTKCPSEMLQIIKRGYWNYREKRRTLDIWGELVTVGSGLSGRLCSEHIGASEPVLCLYVFIFNAGELIPVYYTGPFLLLFSPYSGTRCMCQLTQTQFFPQLHVIGFVCVYVYVCAHVRLCIRTGLCGYAYAEIREHLPRVGSLLPYSSAGLTYVVRLDIRKRLSQLSHLPGPQLLL